MEKDLAAALMEYVREVNRLHAQGDFSEHTFRSPLERLLGSGFSHDSKIRVVQEPSGEEIPGTPDFVIRSGLFPLGLVECKAIDRSLETLIESEGVAKQLEKYRKAIDNLIFTNYREFWLFQARKGEPVATLNLGLPGRLSYSSANAEGLGELFEAFWKFRPEIATTPEELARFLAGRAGVLREQITERLKRDIPTGAGPVVPYYHAFKELLIRDIEPEAFADAYAQTVAYGLFMARSLYQGVDFTRQKARGLLPDTFHLVKTLFDHISGDIPFDLEWVVDSMAMTLNEAALRDILSAFKKHKAEEDPFMHFYETFLAAFNPYERERRGVYFTPRPVVSFIVNSVNHLLKTRFGKEGGLADSSVTLLDPALGTGTFLEYAMRLTRDEVVEVGLEGAFAETVRNHILENFYGFELLVAPYTIAHMKLAMTLEDIGYRLSENERLRVYLTNTLDPQEIKWEIFPLPFLKDLTDESRAANEVKTKTPILVIMGNPPYSGISANKNPWIDGLLKGRLLNNNNFNNNAGLDSYYEVDGKPLGEKKLWLRDDYVKFIRFGQWKIDKEGQGILAFINNHAYLDNPTFRGMRQSLLKSFTEIYILNLHGSSKRKERAPDGSRDENVFDIRQGGSRSAYSSSRRAKKALPGFTMLTSGEPGKPNTISSEPAS